MCVISGSYSEHPAVAECGTISYIHIVSVTMFRDTKPGIHG